MGNSRLVYSTEDGRMCKACGKPTAKCVCKKKQAMSKVRTDGIIRIRREVKGRKGKTVTVASGFELDGAELKALAALLKRRCGTGGSVKDGDIVIQGDHRDILLSEIKKQGYKVKIAGG